ncbi:MAG: DNA mismatch repair protein MutS [Bacteroidales bacterium]
MTEKGKYAETPLMKQYFNIKGKHPDAILLFRVGDFYETFGEDAIRAASILGITLTRRANGAASFVELAGFPYHALDTYLPKLVRAGERVAICEQLEDPKLTKKIVKRGITELITPGVTLDDNVLNHKENNYLAAIHFSSQAAGIALLDISTGEFLVAEGPPAYIDQVLNNFRPREVLYQKGRTAEYEELFGGSFYTYKLDDWVFTPDSAEDRMLKHFGTASLKGFGIQGMSFGVTAAGAVLYYLDLTEHDRRGHITSVRRIEQDSYVWLDRFTARNLELFSSPYEGARTLLDIVDCTSGPMGGRMIRQWLSLPLKSIERIGSRHDIVGFLKDDRELRDKIAAEISMAGDIERIISKVATGRISPREVGQLKRALESVRRIKELCSGTGCVPLDREGDAIDPCSDAALRIDRELSDDPPVALSRGNVIREGVSEELDDLRKIVKSGKNYLVDIQRRESEKWGIPSLKVGFNNVFGYYIEVRNTHRDKVPDEWTRKQTLVSAERYITAELKEYETKILGAGEKILALEQSLFTALVESLAEYIPAVQASAGVVARLDCLSAFARLAAENNYIRPLLDESLVIDIKEGRHPVIEKQLPAGESFVPNDLYLDNATQQIIVLTGPNMSGKSALLRQTALIVLLAQAGSYVPATSARIGMVDKIFTRVGASDNISLGESTFMVEMNETASILNNLSDRSLVLLDEIGRGTSTYDGISIAWAMVEYLHEHRTRARTLFATHYHELNEMENSFGRVKNYNVSIRELEDKIIFLRKLKRGGSEHSFGIHVARMAGMPASIVKRAGEVMAGLEGERKSGPVTRPVDEIASGREGLQLSFFQLDDPVLKQIRDQLLDINIDNLTPVEALNKLDSVKRLLKK